MGWHSIINHHSIERKRITSNADDTISTAFTNGGWFTITGGMVIWKA